MSYKINYLEDIRTVQVDVQGRVNFGMAQEYSKEALRLAHKSDWNKFLLNHSQTLMEAGGLKIHTDGYTLEKFGFSSSDKVAIIIPGDHTDGLFVEKTDANVNWCNFKYFNSIDNAIKWLVEEN